MFEDDPSINDFPYFGDTDNYFPTIKNTLSYNFGAIKVDSTKRDNFIFEEIKFGMETLKINDKPLLYSERETAFLNVRATREGSTK